MASPSELMALNQYELGPGRLTGKGGGGGIMDLLAGIMQQQKIKEEERLKKEQKKTDMYSTLRASGYEPKKAFDAVMKSEFPQEPGGETLKEKETNARVNKLNAETDRIKTKPSSTLRNEVMQKIADGEELTVGEQKIYDEVIKKYGKKSDLEPILKKKVDKIDQTSSDGDYVPMVNPAGQNKKVPRANVEKAKAKGWKLR